MAQLIDDKYLIIKNSDIEKYLDEEDKEALSGMLKIIASGRAADGKSTSNIYFVCNVDEPYADQIIQTILQGEEKKRRENNGR